jgi:sterol 24-C-methyltransferase
MQSFHAFAIANASLGGSSFSRRRRAAALRSTRAQTHTHHNTAANKNNKNKQTKGWGASFHFAHRYRLESHGESIRRHEHFLALRLGAGPGTHLLDVGCGIGGPMREICLFSGAQVTGINNNSYQIGRALALNAAAGHDLNGRCKFVKADFMKMPFADATFDGVYEIDATCHAPDQVGCYSEVFRTLKPGAAFSGYEWCATPLYDASNAEHRRILAEIELGNGLPDTRTTAETKAALEAAGFVVEDARDLALDADVPWYDPIDPDSWRLSNFKTTKLGRAVTHGLVRALERVGVAPKGSLEVATMLERAADGLVAGGKTGIFTPLYFFCARKPAAPRAAAATNGH